MAERVAVMDLGTNTFHLLIVERNSNDIKKLCHLENSCRLGEDGMPGGRIKPEAFERGLTALIQFKKSIDEFSPQKIKVMGTSALRSAKNGNEFIDKVKNKTGIEIEPINGEIEARYIYKGVKTSKILSDETSLILDIGGGSIEFIICNQDQIFWKQSYEIGAARLMNEFHLSDPIHNDEISSLQKHLDTILPEVYEQVNCNGVKSIVGSSGAFETFAALAEANNGRHYDLNATPAYQFAYDDLKHVLDEIIDSTHGEREANKNIIPVRVDMIVVASVVTRYLMQKLGIQRVAMSVYSLKEGVLAELLE